jgi:hypothetical protein
MAPNNPNGYVNGDILVQAVTGYDISTYMYRYSKTDGTLLSETLVVTSVYAKLDEVVVRIEDPNAPQNPTEPSVPTDPTESTDPTDSTDPTESTDPTDPIDPTDPVEPTEPENPTDPIDPIA